MMALGKKETSNFSLKLEVSDEDLWFAIRSIRHSRTGFTAADLAQVTGASEGKAATYLGQLVAHGLAQMAGHTKGSNNAVYVVMPHGPQPVLFDGKGGVSDDYFVRHSIWRAIRMMKGFSLKKLVDTVVEGTEGQVSRRSVQKYIKRLEKAGYLTVMEGMDRFGNPEYGLKVTMNTGPKPPRLCEASLVFDPNCNGFYGAGLAHEVRLSEVKL